MISENLMSLVLVDATVQDYQVLVGNLRHEAEVVVLDAQQDGVAQITQALADRSSIQSLHILSHGNVGKLHLGNTELSSANLERYQSQIQNWSTALTADANILLYGCEVAAGAAGQAFVQTLSDWTQAEVAASDNLTGSAALGGDWELEFATGDIHTPIAFEDEAIEAYAFVLATLLDESFRNNDVTDNTAWLYGTGAGSANPFLTARTSTSPSGVGGLAGGGTDANGDGALRLTSNANDQAAFVIYNKPIASTNGLSITFELFSYNGSGADGINFFLFDAAQTNVTAGAYGGSLGYAQRDVPAITGIEGGYLGIGFDEFGNYSSGTEGRVNDAGTGGIFADAIAIRGSEANQYRYLTGTGSFATGLDNPSATNRNDPGTKKTAKIDITPNGSTATVSVKIDLNGDGDFLDANEAPASLANYTVPTINGTLPANFKFGFASSTGDGTNIHEIRNLRITNALPGVTFSGTGVTVGSSGIPTVTTIEGGAATIVNAVLNTRPSSNVTLNLLSNDLTEGTVTPPALIFTPDNWDVPQALTITPVDDPLPDGNIAYTVSTVLSSTDPIYTAIDPADISVTNNDNEAVSPNVTLALTGSPLSENGGVATVTATLSAATTVPVTIGLDFTGTAVNGTDYTPSASSIVIAPGGTTGTATLTGVPDALVEGSETVIVDAATVTNGTEATPQQVTATITDATPASPNVTLTLTGSPLAEGGGVATVTAALSSVTTVPVTVNLGFTGTATSGTDYLPSAASITIPAGGTAGIVTLTGLADTAVEGNETVIVSATSVTGGTAATPQQVNATITDGTIAPNSPPIFSPIVPPAVAPSNIVSIPGITAIDADGIGAYTITAVPTADQGSLFLGDPATGGTAVSVGQAIAPTQIGQLFFRAAESFTGSSFALTATDSLGATSAPQVVRVNAAALPPIPNPDTGCVDGTPIFGNNRNNRRLNGANGVNDTIFGRGGNDRIRGRGCNDLLDGGAGNDTIFGNADQDVLRGRLGNDSLAGGSGNDILNGGLGSDRLSGGSGNDQLKGRRGLDLLIGGGGNDVMSGGLRNDRLRGGAGDDIVDGGRGDDFVKGGGGNDILTGRTGRDTLVGLAGDDTIAGGLNNDILIGSAGADRLTGNRGRDVFEYRSLGDAGDTITDFAANRDSINLRRISGGRSFDSFVTLTQAGSDTLVRVGSGSTLTTLATLTGVTANSLGAGNFVV
jgi:Domain of unknown function (DUF4347)/RTX calcium-binding nonapeptide repeat (4 copies)/Calx-beta domain